MSSLAMIGILRMRVAVVVMDGFTLAKFEHLINKSQGSKPSTQKPLALHQRQKHNSSHIVDRFPKRPQRVRGSCLPAGFGMGNGASFACVGSRARKNASWNASTHAATTGGARASAGGIESLRATPAPRQSEEIEQLPAELIEVKVERDDYAATV